MTLILLMLIGAWPACFTTLFDTYLNVLVWYLVCIFCSKLLLVVTKISSCYVMLWCNLPAVPDTLFSVDRSMG